MNSLREKTKAILLLASVALILASVMPFAFGAINGDHNSVTNYQIISVTQTGSTQLTVRVEADFCSGCNPNTALASGCTPFHHGYPGIPPYPSTYYGCGGLPDYVDGRYVAIQVRDSSNTIVGSTKYICDPLNWPINTLNYQQDIVVPASLASGATCTVEADIYCGWCGHWYPVPSTVTVAALTSIVVTPPNAILPIGTTQGFSAVGYDNLGFQVSINPTWSVTPGIGTFSPATGPSTTFTGTAAGTGTVVATVGSVSGSANPVTVYIPNSPPDCSNAYPSDSVLWPPNHKMAPIQIMGVTDPDFDPVTITIYAIKQDEPTNGLGDGDKSPDADGIGTDTAWVRRERSGLGDGRVYKIFFKAYDDKMAYCLGFVYVEVPHDVKDTAVNSGIIYDSTKP